MKSILKGQQISAAQVQTTPVRRIGEWPACQLNCPTTKIWFPKTHPIPPSHCLPCDCLLPPMPADFCCSDAGQTCQKSRCRPHQSEEERSTAAPEAKLTATKSSPQLGQRLPPGSEVKKSRPQRSEAQKGNKIQGTNIQQIQMQKSTPRPIIISSPDASMPN